MNLLVKLCLFVLGPTLALVFGSLGVELIEETFFGWLLFLVGASYPPGAIIFYHRYLKHSHK
jgi:hypothetical protein